jgi:hypothetical protein
MTTHTTFTVTYLFPTAVIKTSSPPGIYVSYLSYFCTLAEHSTFGALLPLSEAAFSVGLFACKIYTFDVRTRLQETSRQCQ